MSSSSPGRRAGSVGPSPWPPRRGGSHVALLARSTADLEAVASLTGGVPLACDVGDPAAVRSAMDAVVDRFGRIDVVVANAGVGSYGPFTDLTDEALDALVRTNVLGVMHVVRAAMAPMGAAGRGRIVLVGSIAGRIGVPLEAAYSATKHAVDGLGRALAAELRPSGIAVTVVNLGPIDTGFAETSGHTYERRRPRPMPVERAAAAVLRAADRRAVEAIRPRWLRISVITDALAPPLYVRGAERACAGELRGFREMARGNESAAGVPTTLSAREHADLLARAGEENFSVAPRFLPAAVRADLMALYGYARLVDWLGDEYDGDRLAMLDWAADSIDRAADGADDVEPVFARAGATIRHHDLPRQPFHDLIEANRRDQVVTRYATFDDLLDYCRLSANPVGRMVLGVFGTPTPERRPGPTTCARRCRSSSTARTSARTPAPGGSTCRPTTSPRRCARTTSCSPRARRPGCAPSCWPRPSGPGPCSPRGHRWPPRCRGRTRWLSPASWPAGWPPSTPSSGSAATCSGTAASRAPVARWCVWATSCGRPGPGARPRERASPGGVRRVRSDHRPRGQELRLRHPAARRPRRDAMSAVYALARRIDDIGDGDLAPDAKLDALGSRPWEHQRR